ncbi:MAG: hypothetical protein ABII00_14815, partial [Elusimicrobiota bacterium]
MTIRGQKATADGKDGYDGSETKPAGAGLTQRNPGAAGKGGKAMKKTLAMVALMGLMVTWTGTAWADADLSNDS